MTVGECVNVPRTPTSALRGRAESRGSVTVNRLSVAVETPPNSVNLNVAQEFERFSVYSSSETDLGPAEYNVIIILSAEQTLTRGCVTEPS